MRTLVLLALLAACPSEPTPRPRAKPGPSDAAPPLSPGLDCVRDSDCALLPTAITCCGECPPAPPFEVGTRENLDALLIESEIRCAHDTGPCAPLVCDPVPAGCYATAACVEGRCAVATDGCTPPRS